MVNKYYKRSKISEAKFRQILKYLSMDLTATETAALSSVSLRSVTVIYDKLRAKIIHRTENLCNLVVGKHGLNFFIYLIFKILLY